MPTLIFCRRLAEIHVIPHHQSCVWIDYWWYNHAPHLVFSATALAFVTKISGKCKSTSPSAIQVKNWQKTIIIEEKLLVISLLEKVEQIVGRCCDVRLAVAYMQFMIMLIELKKSAKCLRNINASNLKQGVFVQRKTTPVTSEWTVPKTMDVSLSHFYCMRNKWICCIELYVCSVQMYIHCRYSTCNNSRGL